MHSIWFAGEISPIGEELRLCSFSYFYNIAHISAPTVKLTYEKQTLIMRLLHTTSLNINEFYGNSIPPYAILSHRWENEEVSFQDLRGDKAAKMAGYGKIRGCCAQAANDGWEYAVGLFI